MKKNFVRKVLPAAMLILALTACSSNSAAGSGEQQAASAQEDTAADSQTSVEGAAETEEAVDAAVSETADEAAEISQEGASEAAAASETAAAPVAAEADPEATLVGNEGMVLPIPLEYSEQVIVSDAPDAFGEGMLFSVSEKASVDADRALGNDDEGDFGAGWLFGIGKISEEEGHSRLCQDMSGQDIFARDEEGNYYILYHPTDVRFVRETVEEMQQDSEQWAALNEWAHIDVPEDFIKANEGLTAEKHSNTALDLFLAQIAYQGDVKFTLSTTEFGPVEAEGTDASAYLAEFLDGRVVFEAADGEEAPDGEYVVMDFPDGGMRFDFFLMEGKENYVREVWGEGEDDWTLYKAVFQDETVKASSLMNDWYQAAAGKG